MTFVHQSVYAQYGGWSNTAGTTTTTFSGGSTGGGSGIAGTYYWYPVLPSQRDPHTIHPAQETVVMKKETDVLLFDAEGHLLKTCDDMQDAERQAKRLAAKNEDEIRIVRCVKVVRPKVVEVEVQDV